MKYISKSSGELRRYDSMADICHTTKDQDLENAERLIAAERARLVGTEGYTVDQFEATMRKAVIAGIEKRDRSDANK